MGRIRERLKRVPWMNNNEQRSDQLDYAGESIEAEFQKLESHIGILQKIVHGQDGLKSRIEALEPEDPFEPKDPLPYDRHGKPEGGLKPGDVISYKWKDLDTERKTKGLFSHREEKEGQMCAMAWWDLNSTLGFMPLSEVTFEFRPKPEKS